MRVRSRGSWFMERFGLLAVVLVVGLAGPGFVYAQEATPGATPEVTTGATAESIRLPDDTPDLAAMMLRSGDLDESLGLVRGELRSVDTHATILAGSLGREPDELRSELDAAGWQVRYATFFEENSTLLSTSTASYVTFYEDTEGAEAGFELLEDEAEIENVEDVEDAPELGDQSELTRTTGVATTTTNPFESLDYTFRVDNFTAGVTITDFTGEDVDQDQIADLADLVLERIHTAIEDETPEFFRTVLRLEPGELATTQVASESYQLIDGDVLRFSNESEVGVANRAEFWRENDVESVYGYQGYFQPNGETDSNRSLSILTRLYTFGDEEAAEAFVTTAIEDSTENSEGFENVERLDDVPDFEGDGVGEASALSYDLRLTDDLVSSGFRYWVSIDSAVVSIQLDIVDGPDEDAVVDLVQAQIDCVGKDSPCEPVTVTEDLLGR